MDVRRVRHTVAAGVIAAMVLIVGADPASAATVTTVTDGLAGPLQLSVRWDGTILVSQSFSGAVSKVDRHGNVTDLVTEPGLDLGGVAAGPFTSTYFTRTETTGTPEDGELIAAGVFKRSAKGTVTEVADTLQYDTDHNPDAGNLYGLQGLDEACLAQLPGPPFTPYNGIVESHPYALARWFGGSFLADAAGNDILWVSDSGRIRTVAVLPPQPVVISEEMAAAFEMPPCVAGHTFNFEPVPTDVEVHGVNLYVTTLPGGPEDPSAGARGSVYKINIFTGKATQIATGFAGATNLAVTPSGKIYVAELFGNQISRVVNGHGVPVVELPSPAAVEYHAGQLIATADAFGNGQIVKITP